MKRPVSATPCSLLQVQSQTSTADQDLFRNTQGKFPVSVFFLPDVVIASRVVRDAIPPILCQATAISQST